MSFVKVGSEIQLRFFLEPVIISNVLKDNIRVLTHRDS